MLTLVVPFTRLRQQLVCSLGDWKALHVATMQRTTNQWSWSSQVQGDCYTDGKPGLEGAS